MSTVTLVATSEPAHTATTEEATITETINALDRQTTAVEEETIAGKIGAFDKETATIEEGTTDDALNLSDKDMAAAQEETINDTIDALDKGTATADKTTITQTTDGLAKQPVSAEESTIAETIPALDKETAMTEEVTITDSIDSLDKELREISLKIHGNPELCFAEVKAHDNIVALIESRGIPVTPHAYGLETSFLAEYGSDGRVVTFCCEYDALPQIGHGCGHNLIATAAIAAFLGTVSAIKQSGGPGRVRLLGTPAEEGGGGKIKLIDAGAFQDANAAMMIHPFPVAPATRGFSGVAYGNCLAVQAFRATFEGKAAHAAFSPWLGANALDAVTLTYSAVSMLRQQTRPSDIIGLIIENGGASSNIISERTVMSCNVRSKTHKECMELLDRVHKCLEGAALATGCTLKIETIHDPYADLRSNKTLCSVFTDTMAAFQKTYKCDLDHMHDGPYGTDMGNVSYVCPSFHGTFHVETPPGVALHSAEFAAAAKKQENHEITIQVAKGMALTAWKVLSDEAVAARMKEDFEQDKLLR